MLHQFWLEEARRRINRLEHADSPQYFAAIVSSHADRSNLAGALIDVDVPGIDYRSASLAQIHGPLEVVRQVRKEITRQANGLMRLTGGLRHFAADLRVMTVAIRSGEGITR